MILHDFTVFYSYLLFLSHVRIGEVLAFQALHQELRDFLDAFRRDSEAAALHVYTVYTEHVGIRWNSIKHLMR